MAGETIQIIYGVDIAVQPAGATAPANLLEIFVVDGGATVPVIKYASKNTTGVPGERARACARACWCVECRFSCAGAVLWPGVARRVRP